MALEADGGREDTYYRRLNCRRGRGRLDDAAEQNNESSAAR